MSIKEFKQHFPKLILKENEPLSLYTYTKTGGPADVVAFPKTTEEVKDVVGWVKKESLPLTVLGNASNLIVKDGGIRGVVMILTEMKQIKIDKKKIIVQSGARLIDTSYAAYEAELTGLEFACGIPGSIGGAVYMNAGAYDGEVSEVIESVTVLTLDGEIKTLDNHELEFSYRHSRIQEIQDIVLEVVFQLKKGHTVEIKERMDELTFLRESKQPLEYPSCGSVFKRPAGYFTGKLIQEAGLQGKIWGGAQISMKHAGFIVNINHATATDYIELIQHIQEVILEKDGVKLVPEVRIIGEDQ
ncbi:MULTISPECIES: UDP-N-acetylmuramate dehydrogenase [Carnobacterium]|uniref:UDP-N-acetylenolpyruvoylglucosamine reductase n=2 Tax=Carnobacterium inhibens TaxID=147709 RepID=U5SEE1_9LACT|nr:MULTISPECIES: UDP-N-acetylmuramate dehydrogenase [Carnobacterium]AGY82222.1 UDP-N-acetylenolpyruvoylglucosamine reductase [Carnobacterium inhibens subsp. gilichinskyi]MBC9824365.1 UDP-N-acetylmuramate dehydrogenase [Carnobacterium inhibens]MDN5371205.1 UDP-N-acetylmuramate dehydrogenase [Carnobacterium sp.]